MKLIVRRAAAREAAKAKRWYDTRDQTEEERLGDAFMAEFERVVDSLTSLPKRFPLVYPPLRRALLNRFPYTVYFRLRGEDVVVVAVLHARQSTSVLKGRR